jgi:TolA-binding protein
VDASAAAALPATASAPQAFGTTRTAADAGSASSPVAERAPAPAAMQSESTRQKTAVPAAAPPVPPAPPATAADQDMPIDDVPPATVASPQVRDAWLARIRELAADGNIEEARASLREFQHRYPDYPLPQDLRALLP